MVNRLVVKYCLVSIYRKLLIMKYFLSELNDFGKFVSSFIRVMKPTAQVELIFVSKVLILGVLGINY